MSETQTPEQGGTSLIRTLKEVALYPPHPPRQPTPLFIKNHKAMIDNDVPCVGCGVKHSTLSAPAGSPENPWGATQIESHHWIIEDSLADAIDLDYFNQHILPGVAKNTGNAAKYAQPFTQDQMIAWIHGDADNLICLCDLCHRHPYVGIHAITYPIWRARRAVKAGYDLTGYHAASPAEATQLTNLPQTTGTAQAPAATTPSSTESGAPA